MRKKDDAMKESAAVQLGDNPTATLDPPPASPTQGGDVFKAITPPSTSTSNGPTSNSWEEEAKILRRKSELLEAEVEELKVFRRKSDLLEADMEESRRMSDLLKNEVEELKKMVGGLNSGSESELALELTRVSDFEDTLEESKNEEDEVEATEISSHPLEKRLLVSILNQLSSGVASIISMRGTAIETGFELEEDLDERIREDEEKLKLLQSSIHDFENIVDGKAIAAAYKSKRLTDKTWAREGTEEDFEKDDFDDDTPRRQPRRSSIKQTVSQIFCRKCLRASMKFSPFEETKKFSLQESLYLFLLTEDVFSRSFIFAFIIFAMAATILVISISNAFVGGTVDNPLSIPENVSLQTRIAQFLGTVVGVLTEQETVQGIMLAESVFKCDTTFNGRIISSQRILLCSVCFFVVGYLFLINLAIVVAQSNDVLTLFGDILTLEFVLRIDETALFVLQTGMFGSKLHNSAHNIEHLEFRRTGKSMLGRFLKCVYASNALVLLLWTFILSSKQSAGEYGCHSYTVSFPSDLTWDEAVIQTDSGEFDYRPLKFSYFNGVYKKEDRYNGYPRYIEQNKESGESFQKTIPAEIKYCNGRWVFSHPNIVRASNTAIASENENDDSCGWLMRSPKTLSFELEEIARSGGWDTWTGHIESDTQLTVVCNTCAESDDCNFNGRCIDRKCVCNRMFYGEQCELEMPCSVLVSEHESLGDRTQLLTVPSKKAREGFVASYNRPIYTISGLSGVPKALIGFNSEGSRRLESGMALFNDDDFFRPSKSIFEKEPFDDVILLNLTNSKQVSLRNYAVVLSFTGSQWLATVEDPDLGIRLGKNPDWHAFWSNAFADAVLVSATTSDFSPVGIEFYAPRRRNDEKDYGPFGILVPLSDVEGVGLFQCQDEDCSVVEFNITTEEKELPQNIHDFDALDHDISWRLYRGNPRDYMYHTMNFHSKSLQFLTESKNILTGSRFNYRYCLPRGQYTLNVKDSLCKSSFWECEGPGKIGYNISIDGEIVSNIDATIQESTFQFILSKHPEIRDVNYDGLSSCGEENKFNLVIHTDESPFETSWVLTKTDADEVISGGPYSFDRYFSTFHHAACLEPGSSYVFTIFDKGSNGLNADGFFDIYVGGSYLVQRQRHFNSSWTSSFHVSNVKSLMQDATPSQSDFLLSFEESSQHVEKCIEVALYPSLDAGLWTMVKEETGLYIFHPREISPMNPRAPCLYGGVYTFVSVTTDPQDYSLSISDFNTFQSSIFEGLVNSRDKFSLEVESGLGVVALNHHCMEDDFHFHIDSPNGASVTWTLIRVDDGNSDRKILFSGGPYGVIMDFNHYSCLQSGIYEIVVEGSAESLGEGIYDFSSGANSFSQGVTKAHFVIWKLDEKSSVLTTMNSNIDGYQFGWSVCLGVDTAVIGAPLDHGNVEASGAAYVFALQDGEWILLTAIVPEDGAEGDEFGASVYVEDDTLLIGAPNSTDGGAVYIYTRSGDGMWNKHAKVVPNDVVEGDRFGHDISVFDGIAIVSAPGHGAVYVFRKRDNSWFEDDKIVPNNFEWNITPIPEEGLSLCIYQDKAIIGSPEDSSALILVRSNDGTWSKEATIEPQEYAWLFGYSVCLEDNIAIVGAPYDDENGYDSGAAFIFARGEDGLWSEEARLTPHDAAPRKLFGDSVSLDNGIAIVSTSFAAYHFVRSEAGWVEQGKLQVRESDWGGHDFINLFHRHGMVLIGNTEGNLAYILPSPPVTTSINEKCSMIDVNIWHDCHPMDASFTLKYRTATQDFSESGSGPEASSVVFERTSTMLDEDKLVSKRLCLRDGEYEALISIGPEPEGRFIITASSGEVIGKGEGTFGTEYKVSFNIPFLISTTCDGEDDYNCPSNLFCNFDDGQDGGVCKHCESFQSLEQCYSDGLPHLAAEACASTCFLSASKSSSTPHSTTNPTAIDSTTPPTSPKTSSNPITISSTIPPNHSSNHPASSSLTNTYSTTSTPLPPSNPLTSPPSSNPSTLGPSAAALTSPPPSAPSCHIIEIGLYNAASSPGSGWILTKIDLANDNTESFVDSYFPIVYESKHGKVRSLCLEEGQYKIAAYKGNEGGDSIEYIVVSEGAVVAQGGDFEMTQSTEFAIPFNP